MEALQKTIEAAWADREQLKSADTQAAIREVIEHLDKGRLRVAEPLANGRWQVMGEKGRHPLFPDPADGNDRGAALRIPR